ncbi:MAG: PqqD family protein [Clostridia bacterium]|nr:PqqD family protein [Clostridia bacterium]
MGLKYAFKVRTLLDEIVAFPEGKDARKFGGALALNETGAEIFALLQKGMEEPEIIAELQKKYGPDDEKLPAYVSAFLNQLRQAEILE